MARTRSGCRGTGSAAVSVCVQGRRTMWDEWDGHFSRKSVFASSLALRAVSLELIGNSSVMEIDVNKEVYSFRWSRGTEKQVLSLLEERGWALPSTWKLVGKQGSGLTDEVRLAACVQLSPTLSAVPRLCAVQSQALVLFRKPQSSDALRRWSLKPEDICAARVTCGAGLYLAQKEKMLFHG